MLFVSIASSCNYGGYRRGGRTANILMDDYDSRLGSRTRCDSGDSYSEELAIRELEDVDSKNVGAYLLQGTCENDDALIFVTVNGYRISSNPNAVESMGSGA